MTKNKLLLLSLVISILLVATLANAEDYNFSLRKGETAEQPFNYTNTQSENVDVNFSVVNIVYVPAEDMKDTALNFDFEDGFHQNVSTGVKIDDKLTIEATGDAGYGSYTAEINAEVTNSTGTTNEKIHNLNIDVIENKRPEFTGVEDFNLTVGETKEVSINVTDADDDNLTITWTGEPSGMSISEDNNEITITWTPSSAVEETTVTLTADDGFDEVSETFKARAIHSGFNLDIPEIELGSNSQQRELTVKSFTIKNTGSEAVNDLDVTVNTNSLGFNITQEPAQSLDPEETTTMQITLDIPLDQDSGKEEIGTLTFNYDEKTELKDVYLTTKANIEFHDDIEYEVNDDDNEDLEDGDSIDVEPGDEVVITLAIESLIDDVEFDEDYIEVIVECDEFDYDEDKTATGTLEDDGDETDDMEFVIDVPYDADDGKHDASIKVEAEDENDAMHILEFEFEFDVDKPRHNIRIVDMRFSNSRVKAGGTARLDIEIENTGEDDEDRVYLELENSELGIEKRLGPFDLDDGDDYSTTVTLDIPENVEEREYVFYVEAMYDMDEETDDGFVTLSVYTDDEQEQEDEEEEEQEDVVIVSDENLQEPSYGEPIENKGIFGENSLTILVVILIIVIIALLVIILIPGKK